MRTVSYPSLGVMASGYLTYNADCCSIEPVLDVSVRLCSAVHQRHAHSLVCVCGE